LAIFGASTKFEFFDALPRRLDWDLSLEGLEEDTSEAGKIVDDLDTETAPEKNLHETQNLAAKMPPPRLTLAWHPEFSITNVQCDGITFGGQLPSTAEDEDADADILTDPDEQELMLELQEDDAVNTADETLERAAAAKPPKAQVQRSRSKKVVRQPSIASSSSEGDSNASGDASS